MGFELPRWDLSVPDWERRIMAGESLMPDVPLNQHEAEFGLAIFDELRLPDVPGQPTMAQACGPWFREFVRYVCGSWYPEHGPLDVEGKPIGKRYIRDFLALLPKGQSKTTYVAGLLVTLLLLNQRPDAEALFVGPTQIIAENAYSKAVGMIEASPDLMRRFHCMDHQKTIRCLVTGTELKIKAFSDVLTGSILIFAVLEELHLLGKNQHAGHVLGQIRGGLLKRPEGVLIMPTTMPFIIPTGVFKTELDNARGIRSGDVTDGRPLLPMMYEFPPSIAKHKTAWQDTSNWHLVSPNLGRSMHLQDMIEDWNTEKTKGDHERRVWASQHLNIEIGVGMRGDGWSGADYWDRGLDEAVSLDSILETSDAVVVGVDGGGLDDLFGVTALGRHKETRAWSSWSHAWCHEGVLERRKSIASRLEEARSAGELTIVNDELTDLSDIVGLVERVKDAKLLACVACDPAALGEFVEELKLIGVTEEAGNLKGVPQGIAMMNAIKTAERKLVNGTLKHARSRLMDWCVQNVRIEQQATGIRATKLNAGDDKIDPVMALFDAVFVMEKNPVVEKVVVSVYERIAIAEREAAAQAELARAGLRIV